jgi:uncharacterized protein YprB with RNaseH-like and TPR domain
MSGSKLTERLRGILKTSTTGETDVPEPSGEARPTCRQPASDSLELTLGGQWHGTDAARVFVVERRLSSGARHGNFRVLDCANRLKESLPRAALLLRQVPARCPFIFFDLETTGLNGGAGTYAFLIGCGWFDDCGSFVTRQYFLADCAGEGAMLDGVMQDLGRAGVLVSFNGKSFDAPLLETRYLFHRRPWIGAGVAHLDVLHPARRFWGGGDRDANCSLGTLETRLAGVRRLDDVQGFEIPARYFQYVRSGDARPLRDVLEHNRQDLLSLAAVTARLLELVEKGSGSTGDAREALALGHVYADAGADAGAREAYRRAVFLTVASDRPMSPPAGESPATSLRVAALRALARAERRARAFDDAADCWARILDLPECPARIAAEALEALAVHHEHRRRDLATARTLALRSLGHQSRPSWNEAVRHRVARLDKKLERLTEPGLFPFLSSPPSCGSQTSARRTSS